MSGYRAKPMSRADIRRHVRYLKNKVGLENELYFPILHFAETILPVMIPGYQFEVVSESEMGEKHGETFPDKNLVRIREDVYLRAASGEGRDRLTIAHEIGHLFLHENDSISFCRIDSDLELKPYEDPEWQADAFGGELLASSYLIRGMTEQDVQTRCGVSAAAAHVQLKSIK